MNDIPPLISDFAPGLEIPACAPTKSTTSRWTRFPLFIWKLFLGMYACLSLVGGMLAVGWSYRLAQRFALKRWWKLARRRQESGTFEDFLSADDSTRPHLRWPNWILGPQFSEQRRRMTDERSGPYLWRLVKLTTLSLRRNFWTGLQAIFNTWVFTVPAGVLWWFAWYDGWNNSFNKGYEQAFVGPAVSFVGIFAFIAAMYYVPMAQARQAVTGEWKSFYQFRLIWDVIRHRWLASLGLAALYVALGIPVLILKTFPESWPQGHPEIESLSAREVVKMLNHYFFWCGIYIFPAFALLRVLAARIYASAVVEGLESGWICHESLGAFEARALQRLDLVYPRPQPNRHRVLKIAVWAGTRLGRGVSYTLLFFIWFAFISQMYIGAFLKYDSAVGWLNQPLVQLPWFRYVPARIENPIFQLLLAVFVAGGAGLARSLYLKCTRRNASAPPPSPSAAVVG